MCRQFCGCSAVLQQSVCVEAVSVLLEACECERVQTCRLRRFSLSFDTKQASLLPASVWLLQEISGTGPAVSPSLPNAIATLRSQSFEIAGFSVVFTSLVAFEFTCLTGVCAELSFAGKARSTGFAWASSNLQRSCTYIVATRMKMPKRYPRLLRLKPLPRYI